MVDPLSYDCFEYVLVDWMNEGFPLRDYFQILFMLSELRQVK